MAPKTRSAGLLVALLLVPSMSRAADGGPDSFGYTWSDATCSFSHVSAATALGQGNYDYDEVSIGFSFAFYDDSYTDITICSDGALHFDGEEYCAYDNGMMPSGVYALIAPP